MRVSEPPHNLEAEQAVIGCMMLEAEAVVKATDILEAEDFYRESHKLIFAAMESLFNAREAINLIALQDWLEKHQQLDAVGGVGYLLGLQHSMATTAQLEQFAKIVKEQALRRKLILFGRTVVAGATGEENSEAQLEQALTELQSLQRGKDSSSFTDMSGLLEEYLMDVSQKDPEARGYSGLSTSFLGIDKLTNGLQRGDFVILAARPSMGKTAMVLNLVANVMLFNAESCSVGFFSMEMSKKQLMNRLMSLLTSIDSVRLASNRLSEEEWGRVWQAEKLLSEKKLFIDASGGLSVASLRSRARRLQLEQGLDILFIDYLQLMSSGNRGSDRQQAIAEISRELKALARELNIPVVALSQLSRAVEGRQVKRPMMSDLRESGALEQDADIIMFLYRDDYYNRDSAEPGVTELIVAKHRNGAVGSFKFFFEREHCRFVELL